MADLQETLRQTEQAVQAVEVSNVSFVTHDFIAAVSGREGCTKGRDGKDAGGTADTKKIQLSPC